MSTFSSQSGPVPLSSRRFTSGLVFPWSLFRKPFKVVKAVSRRIRIWYSTRHVRMIFHLNGIRFGRRLRAIGVPSVNVSLGGSVTIGDQFTIRTGCGNTRVGSVGSRILVKPKGVLKIGDRVGMSNATIVCEESVEIGDDVFVGGGVQIFDTNFHSTDPAIRTSGHETRSDVKTAPVCIGARVLLGTNSIICKGVTIGDESVIAAGSVVVSSVPAGEIWGGNPARRIK